MGSMQSSVTVSGWLDGTSKRVGVLAMLALCVVLAWDATGWDVAASAWLGGVQGFPLRNNWWLEHVWHDRTRQAMTGLFVLVCLWALWPVGPMRSVDRWDRWAAAAGMVMGLLAVNWIKRNSLTSCPWDVDLFGGQARYVSHWAWGLVDGGPGRCFPGGHASAALAFLAWVPALWRSGPQAARWGWWLGALVLLVGAGLGTVQTLRGAHYVSHTLWTVVVCWWAVWLNGWVWSALARWYRLRCQR
jgi:membrane-associated PAP2 superfamily phosphatase